MLPPKNDSNPPKQRPKLAAFHSQGGKWCHRDSNNIGIPFVVGVSVCIWVYHLSHDSTFQMEPETISMANKFVKLLRSSLNSSCLPMTFETAIRSHFFSFLKPRLFSSVRFSLMKIPPFTSTPSGAYVASLHNFMICVVIRHIFRSLAYFPQLESLKMLLWQWGLVSPLAPSNSQEADALSHGLFTKEQKCMYL